MKCLSEPRLQEYFDKELSQSVMITVEKHLESCPKCKQAFNTIARESTLIRDSLSQAEVPSKVALTPEKRSRKTLWISLSGVAAALLLIVFLFQPKESELTYIYELERRVYEEFQDVDPNKAWHNSQHTIIFDENSGDIIFPS